MTKSQIRKVSKDYFLNKIDMDTWTMFIGEHPDDTFEIAIAVNKIYHAQERLDEYKASSRYMYKIRKYCNFYGWSDIHPFEVIRIINDKTIEVRAMDTIQTEQPKEFHAGGFVGHYSDNNNQAYDFISNEKNQKKRILLSKKGWCHGTFKMSDKPIKFYDYNF